jgi:hypothetical protein
MIDSRREAKVPAALTMVDYCFEFQADLHSFYLDRVIPDPAADASVLPWADCQLLQLAPSSGVQGLISGVAGATTAALAFQIRAWLDGRNTRADCKQTL